MIASFMATAQNGEFKLPDGPASLLSIRQGVQGGTQRISISTDMKSLGTLMDQYEKETMRVRKDARKKMSDTKSTANKSADGKDADDDDDKDAAPDASMPGAP